MLVSFRPVSLVHVLTTRWKWCSSIASLAPGAGCLRFRLRCLLNGTNVGNMSIGSVPVSAFCVALRAAAEGSDVDDVEAAEE